MLEVDETAAVFGGSIVWDFRSGTGELFTPYV